MQYVEHNRERDRIRARLNANFRVNDTINGVLGISTGSTDPRSGNQTLTDQNSRKDFDLDLAYVTWAPNAQWKLTAGKQRYPLAAHRRVLYDNDVNPEGVAINYTTGNFFASTYYDWLAERALAFGNVTTGTNTDSIMFGAQVGYRIPFSDATKLTLAATYFNFDGVQGYNPFFGGNSFGNTTTTSAAVCSRTLPAGPPPTACLLSDFDIIEGFADLTTSLGGRPLRFFIDYAQNTQAEVNPVALEKLDTALRRWRLVMALRRRSGNLGIRRDLPAGREGCAVRPAGRFATLATATRTRMATSSGAVTRSRATGR